MIQGLKFEIPTEFLHVPFPISHWLVYSEVSVQDKHLTNHWKIKQLFDIIVIYQM